MSEQIVFMKLYIVYIIEKHVKKYNMYYQPDMG